VRTTSTIKPRSERRLGGADIGLCLTRIHHDRFTPYEPVSDEVRARDAARGFEHEANVLGLLARTHNSITSIERNTDAVEQTLVAMASGVHLITGGRLESRDGISVGAPDLLVWIDDGYAAVEIKNHKVLGTNGIVGTLTPLAHIAEPVHDPVKFRGNRRRDLLQVAHYNRLVGEAGFAASAPLGGVIGSEKPYGCVWVDLTQGDLSLIAEYKEILTATEKAIAEGRQHPSSPAQPPWWRSECRRCDWSGLCSSQLEAVDDPTLLTKVDADYRRSLKDDGIATINDVANLAPDDDRVPDGSVVLQARARTAGRLLRRGEGDGELTVPSALTEVDFDIETYNGEIYLAGFLITTDGHSSFEPVVNWGGTPEAEAQVVEEMFAKLASLSDDDTIVQHWTNYERRTLTEAAQRHGLSIPGYATVGEWFDDHAVDLCDWTRKNLVSPKGFGLKAIAPLCGFDWRDDDPGGRQSEIWFERVLAGDDEMKTRLLEYNEDDVIAQREIRRWLRSQDDGTGPGTTIPSVHDWPLQDFGADTADISSVSAPESENNGVYRIGG
jgi:predicted RecB family nuclease